MAVSGQPPLSIWAVSDGRAGIENQVLGLAEAVARLRPAEILVKRVCWRPAFDRLPSSLKAPWMLDPASDDVLSEPWPDVWIAAGRATLPLSLWAKARSKGRTFVVQCQDPRWRTGRFDLVVAPRHDGVDGPNALSMTGSPNRITPERMSEAGMAFADRVAPLPRPRAAILIGGRSRAHDLTPERAADVADRIARAVEAEGGSVLVTFSRRTPGEARAVMTERLSRLPGWIWDGEGANPYFAFLDAADHVLVTEDSANMAAEAATTGRPVHILPMVRRGRDDKFRRLHADLAERGATRPFGDRLGEAWTYAPLRETDRAAEILLDSVSSRRRASALQSPP